MTRIAIFGAGLVGVYLGGRLAAGGADVTFIGRDSLVTELASGLRLTDNMGFDSIVAPNNFHVTSDPAVLGDMDLILVTVKSAATAEAGQRIAHYARRGATILSFQNGVSNIDILHDQLPDTQIIAGMIPYNIARRAPAHFHQGTTGQLMAQRNNALTPFLPLFEAGGISLKLHHDMEAVSWSKLIVNLNNAVNALSGLPLATQIMDRYFRRSVALAQFEALALLRKADITPGKYGKLSIRVMPWLFSMPNWLFITLWGRLGNPRIDRHARSSMAEDLAENRLTEVDHINGAVVSLAQNLNSKAPVNARLVALIHEREQGGGPIAGATLLADLKQQK